MLPSPVAPWKGAPLRVLFAAEKPLEGEFSLIAPDGSVAAKSRERHGGPPYFWFAEVASPAAGTWHAKLTRDCAGDAARSRATSPCAPTSRRRRSSAAGSVWPLRNTWNRATENLFSAWIEKLFDAPLDASPSWPALHDVLRDRSRNILFNHLGLGEDEMGMFIRPDCADLPYFLRAYFAFKMGLPFGYSKCTRGGGGAAAEVPAVVQHCQSRRRACRRARTKSRVERSCAEAAGARRRRSAEYLRTIADGVHSGSGRTAAADDNTDYYPVPLTQDTLRPGTVYADPYGHILMIVQARAADRATRPASSSPSTRSPTARSRASASGAAISCSRRIPRSAVPASSASGRSCATTTAACGG